jgi:hypothetical protein
MLDRRLARHARRQPRPGRRFPLLAGGYAGDQQTFGEPFRSATWPRGCPGVLSAGSESSGSSTRGCAAKLARAAQSICVEDASFCWPCQRPGCDPRCSGARSGSGVP